MQKGLVIESGRPIPKTTMDCQVIPYTTTDGLEYYPWTLNISNNNCIIIRTSIVCQRSDQTYLYHRVNITSIYANASGLCARILNQDLAYYNTMPVGGALTYYQDAVGGNPAYVYVKVWGDTSNTYWWKIVVEYAFTKD